MTRVTLWAMSAAAGIVVANNYYSQPLLIHFARDFGVTDLQASSIAMVTQFGYAVGMLLLLPLADRMNTRHFISVMLALAFGAMLAVSQAPTFAALLAFSLVVGCVSIVPQIMPPLASRLAPAGRSGSAVGMVMGGLLLGIILSRFVGGTLGSAFGWQAVYLLGAGMMLVLLVVLHIVIPDVQPTFRGSYADLMRSLVTLARRHRVLRLTSSSAALQFGAFSAFWSTIVFHLAALPQHYGSEVAGMLALFGICGVVAAPAAGRLADTLRPSRLMVASGSVMVAAFVVMGSFGDHLAGLVAAIVLLDLGMQVNHVSSMNRNYSLDGTAVSRVNTIYMVTRFMGAAAGTLVGGLSWHVAGWLGVCGAGATMCIAAVVLQSRLAGYDLTAPAERSPA